LAHIIAKTEGVPLFIEELTRMVLDRAPQNCRRRYWISSPSNWTCSPADFCPDRRRHRSQVLRELAAAAGDITTEALNDSVERLLASGLCILPAREMS